MEKLLLDVFTLNNDFESEVQIGIPACVIIYFCFIITIHQQNSFVKYFPK